MNTKALWLIVALLFCVGLTHSQDAVGGSKKAREMGKSSNPKMETNTGQKDIIWVIVEGGKSLNTKREEVMIKTFEMSRNFVTVEQYAECVIQNQCSLPRDSIDCNWLKVWRERYPANCVNEEQANQYARFKNARVLSKNEWDYAVMRKVASAGGVKEEDYTFPVKVVGPYDSGALTTRDYNSFISQSEYPFGFRLARDSTKPNNDQGTHTSSGVGEEARKNVLQTLSRISSLRDENQAKKGFDGFSGRAAALNNLGPDQIPSEGDVGKKAGFVRVTGIHYRPPPPVANSNSAAAYRTIAEGGSRASIEEREENLVRTGRVVAYSGAGGIVAYLVPAVAMSGIGIPLLLAGCGLAIVGAGIVSYARYRSRR